MFCKALQHLHQYKGKRMDSFEQEYKAFLKSHLINHIDNCNSYKLLDFTLLNFSNNKNLHLDVKEKRQKINIKNWPSLKNIDEQYAFIIDDLAIRKIFAYAPHAGLIVRDNMTKNYYWFSVIDLGMMPKTRVNRPIEKASLQHKGKWIVDLRNAKRASRFLLYGQ